MVSNFPEQMKLCIMFLDFHVARTGQDYMLLIS